jgi:hypothetical protein
MAHPGWGQYAGSLGIFGDPGGSYCWEDDGSGFSQIYIVLTNNSGATAVQFSVPFPDCFPWTVVGETSPFATTIGTAQYGIAVAFGQCLVSPVHVLTITAMGSGWTGEDCCKLQVEPDPSHESGEIIFTDCSVPVPLIGFLGGGSALVSDPGPPVLTGHYPPTGSENQPLDVQLGWTYTLCRGCDLCAWWSHVYFGTEPDPPVVAQWHGYDSYDPGPLAPGTTYYWKVQVVDPCGGEVTSPVYSFTTSDVVPGQKATWGRIKALYQ